MSLSLYNTLSRRVEPFVPLGDPVRLYVCGITPYAEAHVGHAMSYIVFDVLRRYLEYSGYRVLHVQNFTDIEDKIIARAQQLNVASASLTETYIRQYEEEMRRLNVLPAHAYPRATLELPAIIEMVQRLVETGYAYATANGDVYFRVTRKADYGKLSGHRLDDLIAGARVEPGADKENPLDFALWKAAKPGEPAWDSPWGRGRPGWHIECSAMARKYLGQPIDIHGGGMDLIFPHHENEIAQSEACSGQEPFVRYWVHNGLLRLGEEKMSKSLGNLVTIREVVDSFGADALRLFVLSSHYRRPLAFGEEGLAAAARGAERLRLALQGTPVEVVREPSPRTLDAEPFRRQLVEAMNENLSTPQAIAALFDLAREINRGRDQGVDVSVAQATLQELAGVLGLTLLERDQRHASTEPFIELLVDLRGRLRQARQYELADHVRARLTELGITLEDTPQGTRWRPQ